MPPRRILAAIFLAVIASACTPAPKAIAPAQPATFNDVLNNLRRNAPVTQASDANQMTNAEMGILVQQIVLCWHTANTHPKGAFGLALTVNPDRTVADARIIRPTNPAADLAAYRLANETVAELKTGPCSPLPLPPEKYAAWHQLTLNMDFGSP
jgi:hypothetical protein